MPLFYITAKSNESYFLRGVLHGASQCASLSVVIIPCLNIWNLQHRKSKQFLPGHLRDQWQSWEANRKLQNPLWFLRCVTMFWVGNRALCHLLPVVIDELGLLRSWELSTSTANDGLSLNNTPEETPVLTTARTERNQLVSWWDRSFNMPASLSEEEILNDSYQ